MGALYYANHIIKFQKIIEKLAEDEAQCVQRVLDIVKNRLIINEHVYQRISIFSNNTSKFRNLEYSFV